jgi:biotin carboxylase
MTTIILLAAGDPFHRHIGRLKAQGYSVVAIDRDPNAKGRDDADGFVAASVDNVAAIVAAARTFQADVIVALTEAGVRSAAEASAHLRLPGLPIEVAEAATDKIKMRARWRESGLNQPDFALATTTEQARKVVAAIGIPCVMKPTRAWSSKGVSVVMTPADVEPAIVDAFNIHGGPIIVETFISGKLLTAEGFALDHEVEVVAIGDVDTQETDRHRVNMSLQYPANFTQRTVEEAKVLIGNAALSLGLRRSPFHCECMVSDAGVQLIEMAARGGGGHIFSVLYEPMVGFSGIIRQVELLLGKPFEQISRRFPRGGCYRFLSAPSGIIEHVEGVEEASRMPGVIDLAIAIKPGELGGRVTHDNARHGHVCTVGADRDSALDYAKAAASHVHFVMSKKSSSPCNLP